MGDKLYFTQKIIARRRETREKFGKRVVAQQLFEMDVEEMRQTQISLALMDEERKFLRDLFRVETTQLTKAQAMKLRQGWEAK